MELDQLIRISRFAGERFDLIQAAGGNTSVKMSDGSMLIKASGVLLSDVNKDSGYTIVNIQKIKSIVSNEALRNSKNKRERERIASSIINDSTVGTGARPSIETLLHTFLRKYTLHTHSLAVNMIANQPGWRETLQRIFNNHEIALVNYQTPGVELAIELHKELQKFGMPPKLIFLQNHGLIVSSDDPDEVVQLTDMVVVAIEKSLNINFDRYRIVNQISRLMHAAGSAPVIGFLSEDATITEALRINKSSFFTLPFCPDKQVFCGAKSVEINSLDDIESIKSYVATYFEFPKVLIYENHVYLVASNLKKAKETEEVLKFHVMSLTSADISKVNFLPMDEIAYLARWEAEEYRKKI